MKKIILFFVLLIGVTNYAQVSISPSYRGADEEFGKKDIENFKKTTTVFVLSNVYKKEEYEKILKEVWTVTPFIVVNSNDFKVYEYADGNYSIASLYGDILVSDGGTKANYRQIYNYEAGTKYIHANFILKTIDAEKFKKDFVKLKKDDKKYSKKLLEIFQENSSYIAKVPLCINNNFLNEINKIDKLSIENFLSFYNNKFNTYENINVYKNFNEVCVYKMFNEVCFTNTNLGMLKNYFQQISESLSKGEHYGLYDDFSKPELKNLKENILYIPEVYKMEYNAWKWSEKLRDDKEVTALLKDYKYKYEFISDADLEKKILNNEKIYYLRYVSMNANKYLQVVDAQSGNPVYYSYGAMTYNLKDNDFEEINKAINKTNKSK